MTIDLHTLAPDLAACAPALARAIDDGALREPDVEIPVLWAAFVGRALAGAWRQLAPAERAAALGVVERHLARGTELTATAVSTGLLEALASEVSSGRIDGSDLAEHLGPESRAFLDAYDEFTIGRSSLESS